MDVQAHVLARAERAADAAQREAHQLGGEAEALGDLVAVVVQPLRRHDEVDAAVVGRDREAGLGAHERLVLHADLVGALDDDGADGSRGRRAGCRGRGTRCRRDGSAARRRSRARDRRAASSTS